VSVPCALLTGSQVKQDHVCNTKTRTIGLARHLLVTVEQLFKSREGHLPRLYFLVRNLFFQKKITRVNVDEAHSIYTAGTPLYGRDAFRPAWGRLDELKAILSHLTRWAGYSATLPPHILKVVEQKILRPNYVYIHVTSNRPNTLYATHQVTNSIEDLRNYECFLTRPFSLAQQPHVLIFVDDKDLASRIADYLESCLPYEHRKKKFAMHYHSKMSEFYLLTAYNEFTRPDGMCRILVTTSSNSVVCLHIVVDTRPLYQRDFSGYRLSQCQDRVYSWFTSNNCRRITAWWSCFSQLQRACSFYHPFRILGSRNLAR